MPNQKAEENRQAVHRFYEPEVKVRRFHYPGLPLGRERAADPPRKLPHPNTHPRTLGARLVCSLLVLVHHPAFAAAPVRVPDRRATTNIGSDAAVNGCAGGEGAKKQAAGQQGRGGEQPAKDVGEGCSAAVRRTLRWRRSGFEVPVPV